MHLKRGSVDKIANELIEAARNGERHFWRRSDGLRGKRHFEAKLSDGRIVEVHWFALGEHGRRNTESWIKHSEVAWEYLGTGRLYRVNGVEV
jgi:hypothetical protein